MPFTLAHPAAAVPLARRGLVLSALVVGSMAPDFQYFLHMPANDRFSHTIRGVFLFCLPVGYVALWTFHTLLKQPLLALLPYNHRLRLEPVAHAFSFHGTRQFWMVILSLVVGSFTHLMWDSFTHANGWVVQHYGGMSLVVAHLGHHPVPLYTVLQYVSSVAGMALCAYWYHQWYLVVASDPVEVERQCTRRYRNFNRRALLVVMGLTAVAIAIPVAVVNTPTLTPALWFYRFTRTSVIAGLSALAMQLLCFSLWWHRQSPGSGVAWSHHSPDGPRRDQPL